MMSKKIEKNTTPAIAAEPVRSKVHLEGAIELILHTKLAQTLLEGSWGRGKMGLWQFALQVRHLWKRHKADDPYADWYFMKIDEKIHNIREEMQTMQISCQERLATMRGLNIQVFHNPEPMKIELQFVIPFSFMAATLLPEFDYLACQAYTLRHIGQLLASEQLPIRIYYKIRDLFSLPLDWRMPVTRQDILEKNDAAKEAKKKMGEVPTAILNKEIKFIYLLNTMLGSPKIIQNI